MNVINENFGTTGIFKLPDARGCVLGAIGSGFVPTSPIISTLKPLTNRPLGKKVGDETHTLTISEMPAHTHTYSGLGSQNVLAGSTDTAADEASRPSETSGSTGSGGSHNNMQPTLFIGNVFIFAKHQTDSVPA